MCQGRARAQNRRPKYLTLQMLQIQGSEDISKAELSLHCATGGLYQGNCDTSSHVSREIFIFLLST